MAKDIPADDVVLCIIGRMLESVSANLDDKSRPKKEQLLDFIRDGVGKLGLFVVGCTDAETGSRFRKDEVFRNDLLGRIRQKVISLKPSLLNPRRVRKLVAVAGEYPASAVRQDSDLWAARIISQLPESLVDSLPLIELRYLHDRVRGRFQERASRTTSLEELDRLYLFILRELDQTPDLSIFLRRTFELAKSIKNVSDLTAYYSLLSVRIIPALEKMEQSPAKDQLLIMIKDKSGTFDLEASELEFRKRAMGIADDLMKDTGDFDQLLELRFFFGQIGERVSTGLFSRKAGEIVRDMNMKADGYRLLGNITPDELDIRGLTEIIPAVFARSEQIVNEGPVQFLDRLMRFYLKVAVPFFRELKKHPEKQPVVMQNFKRQVGLLNVYRNFDHLLETIQRKLVLAITGPRMLKKNPKKILSYLSHLPPEYYPEKVMQELRKIIREKGVEYEFRPIDVLRLLAVYPDPEEEEGKILEKSNPAREYIDKMYREEKRKP